MTKITNISVRMYRMGTGDCFVLKFLANEEVKYRMMIDCGTWSGSKEKISKYVADLKQDVGGHLDLLVITHEHKDHVYGFEACKDLYRDNFTIDRIWMGWTENDQWPKVEQWKKDFGDKKKALALVSASLLKLSKDPKNKEFLATQHNGEQHLESQKSFAASLDEFNQLHNSIEVGEYVGGLAGMKIVKEELAKDNIEYFEPGEILKNIPNLDGIKFYFLGPPKLWEGEINVDTGGVGESYQHNLKLAECDSFAAAALSMNSGSTDSQPFDEYFITSTETSSITSKIYNDTNNKWRSIDDEWITGAGNFALRINSITNNLSLAFAIEFEDSGRVLLFPGDAEYGSWASWHKIPWTEPVRNGKAHFTEDLLSRTVFYKVAHHLSHNGTAERLGMGMMTHPDLVSMATLDYKVISKNWKNTMPNRDLLKALLKQSRGRFIVMDEEGLYFDKANTITLTDAIKMERAKMSTAEREEFEKAYNNTDDLYLEFNVKG